MSVPSCNDVQEKIARGLLTAAPDRAHAVSCPACAAVAQEWSLVQAAIDDAQSEGVVPDGFADRVMARLGDDLENDQPQPASAGLWERRWVQVVLANVGAVFTLANVLRFVVRVLVPSTSLGALP
jgi:hypothetical protein